MNTVAQELFDVGNRYLMERPEDMSTMRARLGTRGQNMTIQLYAYTSLNGTVELMYQLQEACADEEYDLHTLVKVALNWLSSIAPHHLVVAYRLDNLADITTRAMEELKRAQTRQEVRDLLQGLEHHYNMVRTWIDLEFPWHELSVRYAELKGDPEPRSAP